MRIRKSTVAFAALVGMVSAWFPATLAHAGQSSEVCFTVADDVTVGGEGFPDVLIALDVEDQIPGVTETMLGTTGTDHIEAIAFNAAGTLFAADETNNTNGRLGTVNTTTAAFGSLGTQIGAGQGADGKQSFADTDGLSFDPRDGSLWGTVRRKQGRPDLLIQIDPGTGKFVPNTFGAGVDYVEIEPVKTDLIDIDDIAISNGGTMYAIANKQGGGDRLVTIDRTDGSTTDIGKLGTTDMESLAFSVKGHLWSTTGNKNADEALWKIDPGTAASTRIMDLGIAIDYEALDCKAVPTVAVGVDLADCRFVTGQSLSRLRVDISPAGAAELVLMKGANTIQTFTQDGFIDLVPGNYKWTVTPAQGYLLTTPASGSFTAIDCTESTTVSVETGGCEYYDPQGPNPLGSWTPVSVSMAPDAGATVEIFDAASNLVATFTKAGTVELGPGAYTWTATGANGRVIDGPASGSFTLLDCTPGVVTVAVTLGPCDGGTQQTEFGLLISPAGAATVDLLDSTGAIVATFTGAGGTTQLDPGAYTYSITPAQGFVLKQDATGRVTAVPCPTDAEVSVEVGSCDPEAGEFATRVEVSDPGKVEVVITSIPSATTPAVSARTTKSKTIALPAGSYTWAATSLDPTVKLVGVTSGEFSQSCVLSSAFAGVSCELDEDLKAFAKVELQGETDNVEVSLTGPGVDETFTNSTLVGPLKDGTYSWEAVALKPGIKLEPLRGDDLSGEISVDRVKNGEVGDKVVSVCVLAATGLEVGHVATGGWTFLLVGMMFSLVGTFQPRVMRLFRPGGQTALAGFGITRVPLTGIILGFLARMPMARAVTQWDRSGPDGLAERWRRRRWFAAGEQDQQPPPLL